MHNLHQNTFASPSLNNRKIILRFLITMALFISSFVIGTAGLMEIEGFTFEQAFYMAVITISTVGYGEIYPLSETGRIFMAFFIIYNTLVLAYTLSSMAIYIFEGEIQKIFHFYRQDSKIKKMRNHIIVCGFGRYGKAVCHEISHEKMPFIVIDCQESKIEMAHKLGYTALQGSAMEDESLINAGIKHASTIICCLPRGADNIYITLTARSLNPNIQIIARAEEENDEKKMIAAGANRVIKPNSVSALFIARLVYSPEIVDFMQLLMGLSHQEHTIRTLHFHDLKPQFQNLSIAQLNLCEKTGVNVIGLYDQESKHYSFSPTPNCIIHDKITLIIIGSKQQLDNLFRLYCASS